MARSASCAARWPSSKPWRSSFLTGSRTYPDPRTREELLEALRQTIIEEPVVAEAKAKALRAKFRRVTLAEFAKRPDPIYWDDNKMIPRDDGTGATVIAYGLRG